MVETNKGEIDHNANSHPAIKKIHELYHWLLDHDGFGELRMDVRILKRGQKEIIIHCGKQYRYVVDSPCKCGYKKHQTVESLQS